MASVKKPRPATAAAARASKRPSSKPALAKTTKAATASLATYERDVRKELEKKIGKGSVPTDVYSDAYMRIVERAFKSEIHPTAAAGVLVIASGLAPERAPSGALCCGQR